MKKKSQWFILLFLAIPFISFGQIITGSETPDINCFECTGNTATGTKSFASGYGNSVSGSYSTAFGKNNTVTGNYSHILGQNSYLSADYSFITGINSSCNGVYSGIIGCYDTIAVNNQTSGYSFILGTQSKTSGGAGAIVIGNSSKAFYTNSLAIGSRVHSMGAESFCIGTGSPYSPLENNIPGSLMIGFGSTKPTLFVSTADDLSGSGEVGIGNVTAPKAKLHIKSDGLNDTTSIMLDNPYNTQYSLIYFGNKVDHHKIYASRVSDFKFESR